ncbi:SDR family NAD(P)-dependent oxidoreductase [Deinococcus sonorensis]|uniref:SDR family NAD(P)-dependent oxidoreductase n=2 Tax=Deinococcus sonorensis TaxID=309891 RepID=A0AAU7U6K9_9DEIO
MNVERLDGRIAVVTGGSSGVGLAAAKGLARLGARTILISRREQSAKRAVDEIKRITGNPAVEFALCDLTDPVAVQALIHDLEKQIPHIAVLVSAAGSVGEQGVTSSGIPRAFATNYLGHFFLIRAALPLLNAAPDGRILIVGVMPALIRRLRTVSYSAVGPEMSSTALMNQAVAWKLLLAHHLAVTHPGGPSINVFHPGLIRSNLLSGGTIAAKAIGAIFNRFAKDHCVVVEYLASSSAVTGASGNMFDDRGRRVNLPSIVTAEHADNVWKASVAMTERALGG